MKVGPFVFWWLPDGDDPGVGRLTVECGDGVSCRTGFQVTADKWAAFVEASR